MREHRIFAALYDRMVAPMEREVFGPRRAALLAEVTGHVLDVGAGTGANLDHFRAASRVTAAEPDRAMRRRLADKAARSVLRVEISDAEVEHLPFPDASFDAVVCALVLCTVEDPERALSEACRVLVPSGRLIVLEHVRGDGSLARWQDRVTPLWRIAAAGCHPNRDTRSAIERSGFRFDTVEEFRVPPTWIPTSPMLQGIAVVAK